MAEIYLPVCPVFEYRIHQRAVSRDMLNKRFLGLKEKHIRSILDGMQCGPPVRNLKGYLLTALYQANVTEAVNAARQEKPGGKRKNKFSNFSQRSYDYEELERALLRSQ